MKTSNRRNLLVGLTVLVVLPLLVPSVGARSTYLAAWMNRYGNSQSANNASCQLCHENPGGGNGWNEYGWNVRQVFLAGGGIVNAFATVEQLDSDTDPTLSENLAEIDADTQPGWTVGLKNTLFFSGGATSQNQPPPGIVLGDLDPTIGVNFCTPSVVNSTGLGAVIAAKGSLLAADNDVTLVATNLPQNQFGYFIGGQTQGFIPNPGGSMGNLCLGGTIGRFIIQIRFSGPEGSFSIPLDIANLPPPLNSAVQPGETWNFQSWFRDKNPNTTSNFTDGLAITFQ